MVSIVIYSIQKILKYDPRRFDVPIIHHLVDLNGTGCLAGVQDLQNI